MDETEYGDLDISWVIESERLSKISQNYLRENMDKIQIHSIYINIKNHIDKITSTWHVIDSLCANSVGIKNDIILKLIESNKILQTGNKYKLLDLLVFNIDLDPENIQDFSHSDLIADFSSRFLKSVSVLNDIKIPASIFIFHNLNAIYLIFQEIGNTNITSILKNPNNKLRKTKKVTLIIPDNSVKPRIFY